MMEVSRAKKENIYEYLLYTWPPILLILLKLTKSEPGKKILLKATLTLVAKRVIKSDSVVLAASDQTF